jgi:hypothetical protein
MGLGFVGKKGGSNAATPKEPRTGDMNGTRGIPARDIEVGELFCVGPPDDDPAMFVSLFVDRGRWRWDSRIGVLIRRESGWFNVSPKTSFSEVNDRDMVSP